ncbi:hypothetical protein OKN36_04240 [Furfurilactobacillus sp. OKN36]
MRENNDAEMTMLLVEMCMNLQLKNNGRKREQNHCRLQEACYTNICNVLKDFLMFIWHYSLLF